MKRLLLALLLALAPPGAGAHGYDEFAPLDPELRTALIDVLAAASADGDLAPRSGSDAPRAEGTVEGFLDSTDPAALAGLATRLRSRAGVAEPARLPDSVILPLFYDLDAFLDHYQAHGHDPAGDEAARADYRRLKTILEAFEVE